MIPLYMYALGLKKRHLYILNNSVKTELISTISGVQYPEEISHSQNCTHPPQLNKVATLPCETQK